MVIIKKLGIEKNLYEILKDLNTTLLTKVQMELAPSKIQEEEMPPRKNLESRNSNQKSIAHTLLLYSIAANLHYQYSLSLEYHPS